MSQPALEPKYVTQRELSRVLKLREEVRDHRARLAHAEAVLAHLESDVAGRLRDGALIRKGTLTAVIHQVRGRACPSYKEELLTHFEQTHHIARELVEEQIRQRWPGKLEDKLVVAEQLARKHS